MKLTLQIKLVPTKEQAEILLKTIEEYNQSANKISGIVWDQKCFNQFKAHHLVYYKLKQSTQLTSQLIVRCISKVINSYKTDRKKKHNFSKNGSITYDSRILSYKGDNVSISSVGGRLTMPFVCYKPEWLEFVKGESDLIYRKEKFFLFQTIDIPDENVKDVDDFLGVDLGQTDIASTSLGKNYSSKNLNKVRDRYFRVRKSVQSKGTRGSKRLLKRLSGREHRFASITNHTIAKDIVQTADRLGIGIAIEDLTYIRKARVRKSQKRHQSNWSFFQLRQYIEYKAEMMGIPVSLIDPRYTSKTCNGCKKIGVRVGKHFKCKDCGEFDADINAAKNISQFGVVVNQPERSNLLSCSLHFQV